MTAEWGEAHNDRLTRKGLSEKMKFKLGVAWQEEASPAKPGGENSRVREQLAPQCYGRKRPGAFKNITGSGQ